MTRSNPLAIAALVLAAATCSPCGSAHPTTPTPVAANVTAPALDAPANDEQNVWLGSRPRPTSLGSALSGRF